MYLHNWGDKVKNCNFREPTGKNIEKKHTLIGLWELY